MPSRRLLTVFGWAILCGAAGCTSLLGDFSINPGAGSDASMPDDSGLLDSTVLADAAGGDATVDGSGSANDGATLAEANGSEGSTTTPADAHGGDDGAATESDANSGGDSAAPASDANGSDSAMGAGDAGACNAATVGTVCSPATCTGGVALGQGRCLADGTCQVSGTVTCSPYVCGASACLPRCSLDRDCISGYACAAGACVVQKSQGGSPCTRDAECQSGLSCSPEGICCNAPCNGSCQVCNSAGMCVPVPVNQQPRTGHPACTNGGSAPCGGYCDGVDIACFYPTTACRIASCGCSGIRGGCTALATGNCANGSCPNPVYTSCGGFACDSTGTVCNDVCDPSNDTGCYGLNCCHTVFTGICLHSCTSTCPAAGICQ